VEAEPRPFGGLKPWSPQVLVALLTILFFTLSVWNLGDLRFPSSDFRPQDHPEEVVLDLGTETRVDKVFWLRQDAGSTELEVYSGLPGDWELHKEFSDSGDWRRWDSADFHVDTRYVRLVFTGGTGSIGEVAVFAGDKRLAVAGIEGDRPEAIAALIDEQELIDKPDSHTSGTYFDEIYYVRAAEEHLSLQNPYGERTHPPMSKIIIATSIWALGDNPFAWRFAGVVFATLMIPLIYFFARRMFSSERAGVIAAFLLTFDVMHFAEARIATPETFILFFVMAMFYFFYRYWQDPEHRGSDLFVSLLFFGLGFATKWVVMWGFVGLVVLLLILKWRQPIRRSEVYWFVGGIAAAALIYLLSYIPYFLAGFSLGDVYQHHLDMFSFHSSLEATHGWSSEWYTWPIMWRPLWMYVGHFADTTSHISTFGNPALWWFAIPALIGVLWLALRHRKKTAIFIIVPFLAQWLIFAFIGRCLFIYHYYPNVLFLVLAVTLWAKWLWDRYGWGKWVVGAYLLLNIVAFVLLFPVFSGHPMSSGYWDTLRWMVDWAT